MPRVLVIDDEKMIRNMLRQALQRKGHVVLEAADGAEGIRLHKEKPFDVIVVDIVMPEKEGIETILELKKNDPGVKLIAISGYGGFEPRSYLDTAKKFGVEVTFAKPFNISEFMDAVESLIGEKKNSSE